MPKIVAAVAGAAAIGLGIFFFLGRGESRPKPAVETSTSSSNWISDFATDAKHQRRVSVLRASMGLPAYRLDFESSIQIKGLGWVYRAQDAKNYYVSKIELEKPGTESGVCNCALCGDRRRRAGASSRRRCTWACRWAGTTRSALKP